MKWIFLLVLATLFFGTYIYFPETIFAPDTKITYEPSIATTTSNTSEIVKQKTADTIPDKKILDGFSWVGQTFNNCSSVGLMIALSYWGIVDTQEKIADGTRPWNNRNGNNDDKSVTLYELETYTNDIHPSMVTYVRPNGDINILKKFIANDIPVLTRTLMYPDDDIVHYRVVRGYDDTKKTIIETDGYYGKKYTYTYDEWMHMWKDFNYSYLILVPKEKKELVEKILEEDADEQKAWQHAKERAIDEFSKNSNDMRAKYNEITARFYLRDYQGVISEFEKVEDKLTRRKLWYQMEPIDSYFILGKYDRVIQLADSIINDNNKSVSELYVLKGKIYESRGNIASARAEYNKAIFYNKGLKSAQEALNALK